MLVLTIRAVRALRPARLQRPASTDRRSEEEPDGDPTTRPDRPRSSVLIYGAAALAEVSQEVADRAVQEALDAGINHFDVAAELRRGRGAAGRRLRAGCAAASPTCSSRPRPASARPTTPGGEINESLERLRVDRVDLLQLHAVGDLEDLDRATGQGGALEAALRAQEEGLVGAVGITGHGHDAPTTHLEALRRFPFATVLTPINLVLSRDAAYRSAYDALVEEVQRQDAGLMVIKTVARRNWTDGRSERPRLHDLVRAARRPAHR